jgi:glycine/D-amino acid oxidase-like deaminating enzyme
MGSLLSAAETSYWQASAPASQYPSAKGDIKVDVIVVGGGITGLTTAYLCKQAGLKVAVLEKNTIGSGTTSKTTGKLTSQHNLMYNRLVARHGKKVAKIYADANQTALEMVQELIHSQNIECGLAADDNYVFTTKSSMLNEFKAEARTARALGLPATFETKLDLPFKVVAAVKFAGQAKFNAQKYALALASLVHERGSFVFERSNVTSFYGGQPARVHTGRATITGTDIVVATKVPAGPLAARGVYAALEYPHTSYIVAGRPESEVRGMYISPDQGHYSILPVVNEEGNLLLIGGENHIPGLGRPNKRYKQLAAYARKYFGISTIEYRWKGMDYLAYDNIPLIGKVYPWSEHLYTATGFKKWGLTTSMVAAIILRDAILGQSNPWATVLDSTRLRPVASIPYALFHHSAR